MMFTTNGKRLMNNEQYNINIHMPFVSPFSHVNKNTKLKNANVK